MYQIVLSEGSADDVVALLHLPTLLEVWDELWLSPAVHSAWGAWVQAHRHAAV